MDFSSPRPFPYTSGKVYLGTAQNGQEIGVDVERGVITFAGSRAGKGATEIIPNLLRWPHNAIVIDPKGEAAEATAEHRERALGHQVAVVDPFGSSGVPDRLRKRINVLSEIRFGSNREYTDIQAIADGLVLRSNADAAFFDNGGLDIISGAIVDVLSDSDPTKHNLVEMRRRLREDFDGLIDRCGENDAFNGLAKTAYARVMRSGDGPSGSFISTADDNTKWLDDPAMMDTLSASDFALADLKTKPTTIYLVLDPDLLALHGRFLRLFVRAALNAMTQKIDGNLKGEKCLFILDEFKALGKINEVAVSSGLLPGMGVHLWPFLQNIGQLLDLYGMNDAETFLSGSDAVSFFGVSDPQTLNYASQMVGQKRREKDWFGQEDKEQLDVGSALMSPQEIKQHVQRPTNGGIARNKLVFTSDGSVLSLKPAPYFNPTTIDTRNPIQRIWNLPFFFFALYLCILGVVSVAVAKGEPLAFIGVGLAVYLTWVFGFRKQA